MIEEQRKLIDETVKDYENRQKSEKETAVRAYYNKKAVILGDYADKLYGKLLDTKWLNASTSKSKYEEGIQLAINKANADINDIKALNSPFIDSLMDTYVSTLSIEQVKKQNEQYIEAHNKARISIDSTVVKKEQVVDRQDEGTTLIKIYATSSQLIQIKDFMKAIGVKFEIQ
jgi:hypothetical protein